MKLAAVGHLSEHVGVVAACALVGQSRATAHRRQRPALLGPRPAPAPRRPPAHQLSAAEVAAVLALLNSPRFAEASVAQTWATLLDEGVFWCSQSTMHRILRAAGQGGDRRRTAAHPPRARPELVATGPGQVWSWDVTKVRGPARGQWFCVFVMLDIYSRYVVHWMVAATEDAALAEAFIAEAVAVHGAPGAIHADRGSAMTSKNVATLLADLGILRSHSRPKVSNDNPYSEAAFKTMKYAPDFPETFGSVQDARMHCEAFFGYYNHEHRHSGIGLHTPASVHHGTAGAVRAQRQSTLDDAYAAHPARFARRPVPPPLPTQAWINPPVPSDDQEAAAHSA